MPHCPGQPVAIARGSGAWVGCASGRDDHSGCSIDAPGVPAGGLRHYHPGDASSLDDQVRHRRLGPEVDLLAAGPPHKAIYDVLSVLAGREDTPPTLSDAGHSQIVEEGHQIVREEPRERLAQETAIGAEMRDEVGKWCYIGQVAPALAGDAQLAARAIHLLEQQRTGPPLRGLPGGEQPGCACTDHDHAWFRHGRTSCREAQACAPLQDEAGLSARLMWRCDLVIGLSRGAGAAGLRREHQPR